MVTLPLDFDVETKAKKWLDHWKEGSQDSPIYMDYKETLRLVDLIFPGLKGWNKKIFATMLRQGRYSSVSIARYIRKPKKFVSDYFKSLSSRMTKMGISPSHIFKRTRKETLSPEERAKHGKAPVFELSEDEFRFILLGRLVPLATKLGLATELTSKLLAVLQKNCGDYIGPVPQGLSRGIPLLGDTLILGVWFRLTEDTEKDIWLILKRGSIFKEHPGLFEIFELARRKGVQIRVVITKMASPEVVRGFRDINAEIKFVSVNDLEAMDFVNLRLAIHDREHVIHLEKVSGAKRTAFYFHLKPSIPPLSDYIRAFEEIWKNYS